MKKSVKIALIAALSLLVLGLLLMGLAIGLGLDFTKSPYEVVTHRAEGDFDDISVSVGVANVTLELSSGGDLYAVCDENEKVRYTLTVEDGTLYLREQDARTWMDYFGISFRARTVKLYLPQREYRALTAENAGGSLQCEASELRFDTAALSTSGGNIVFSATVKEGLKVKSSSGRIEVKDVSVSAEIEVKNTSGNLHLENCRAEKITAENTGGHIRLRRIEAVAEIGVGNTSGGITLSDCSADTVAAECSSGSIEGDRVTATSAIRVKATSGAISLDACQAERMALESSSGRIALSDSKPDTVKLTATSGSIVLHNVVAASKIEARLSSGAISLDACDAAELVLESSSGRIGGTLLSEKWFDTRTDSGNVHCPPSVPDAGKCRATTSSGNIKFEILE